MEPKTLPGLPVLDLPVSTRFNRPIKQVGSGSQCYLLWCHRAEDQTHNLGWVPARRRRMVWVVCLCWVGGTALSPPHETLYLKRALPCRSLLSNSGAASCARPGGRSARSSGCRRCIWRVWLRCVSGSVGSARLTWRSASRSSPTCSGTASPLQATRKDRRLMSRVERSKHTNELNNINEECAFWCFAHNKQGSWGTATLPACNAEIL